MTLNLFRSQKEGLFGAAVFSVLVFLFLQSRGVDAATNAEVNQRIQQMKQLDTALRVQVLKLRFGFLSSADGLAQILSGRKASLTGLKKTSSGIYGRNRDLDFRLDALEKAFLEEGTVVNEFISENASFENSSKYFPTLTLKLIKETEGLARGSLIGPALNRLLRDVLLYCSSDDSSVLEEGVRAQASDLSIEREYFPESLKPELDLLLSHMKIILEDKKETDILLRKILGSGTVDDLDRLSGSYAVYYESEMRKSGYYKLGLFFICTALLILVIYSIFRLRKAAADLNTANELLEKRVEQRTAELSKANGELKKEIEDRRRLESIVLQSEKMSAVGQLAAGVAHEINNPLGVMLGFAQSIVKRLEPANPFEMPLRSIEREAVRCKNLVQDLLTFSRAGSAGSAEMDLNQAVESSLSLVLAQGKVKDVKLTKELAQDLPKIFANNNQIQQVVINLCSNAIDAMPDGGVLTVRTANAVLDGKKAIQIQIQDTGFGIPKEIQAKIFEPFFTTKEVGKGTGLGLSLVYEIIQKNEGEITMESQEGKGTLFLVKLPTLT